MHLSGWRSQAKIFSGTPARSLKHGPCPTRRLQRKKNPGFTSAQSSAREGDTVPCPSLSTSGSVESPSDVSVDP